MIKTLRMLLLIAGTGLLAAAAAPATTPQRAKELALDLGDKATLKLAPIPAGKFRMGSPETEKDRGMDECQHTVTISKPFYMAVCEVTVDQYAVFLKDTGTKHEEAGFKQTGGDPAVKVGWEEATAFCAWLSRKTGKTVTLPTEAQWEYACRAGNSGRFAFGDNDEELGTRANYLDKTNTDNMPGKDTTHGDGFDKTAPTGSLKPNAWGLYDMHGNVWEWCADWYDEDYGATDQTDPAGPAKGTHRVMRGGSFLDVPKACRSAQRNRGLPSYRLVGLGFRVVVAGE